MKIKVIGALLFILILIGTGLFFWSKNKRPPIETKFVHNIEQSTKDGVRKQEPEEKHVILKDPGNYILLDNPKHVYQTFNNCGPATLSMIMSYYGKDISQKELGDLMRPYQVAGGDNDDKTIFTYEFVDWAKKYGFEAIGRVNGDIDLIKKFTVNGIPVVVKTWLHVNEDIGHFRVVRGFDETRKVIIQDDSYEGPNKKISYYDFLSMWQPFNYAYVIVYKNEQKDLVEAILGSEVEESTAWANSLERAKIESELDEANVYPRFNMSAAYYHLSDYKNSVLMYEDVEENLPKRMLWYQIEPILAYQQLGNYDRVFQISEHIFENGNRAFSELYQIRGEIYLEKGSYDLAKSEFDKALQYNINFSDAKESLSNI